MIKTPLTRSLIKESIKSSAVGGFLGYGFFKVKEMNYRDALHNY